MGRHHAGPESTALRVALWRALHTEIDAAPHVLTDTVGLAIADPGPRWRDRSDMDPQRTRQFRASIVARARFLEDLVAASLTDGLAQYVILGAGLDTFAQRHPDLRRLRIFEVDQPGPQEWKRTRLQELGFGVPEWLTLVPVDFEDNRTTWWDALAHNGLDASRPTLVASTGVSMYLSREATQTTMRQVAELAPGSTLVMSFMVPVVLLDDAEAGLQTAVEAAARGSGTPFISHYRPAEFEHLALDSGFSAAQCIPPSEIHDRYFAGRTDGLSPGSAEQLLVATV